MAVAGAQLMVDEVRGPPQSRGSPEADGRGRRREADGRGHGRGADGRRGQTRARARTGDGDDAKSAGRILKKVRESKRAE